MNLKEELDKIGIEFSIAMQEIQNAYKLEQEALNAKYQTLDQETRKELSDKQQKLVDKATEMLLHLK